MSFVSASLRLCSVLARRSDLSASRRPAAGLALLFGFCSFALIPLRMSAQDAGSQDPTYAAFVNDVTVYTVALQAGAFNTQRVVLGGDNRILERTTPDGTLDSVFSPSAFFGGDNRTIYTMAFETVFPNTDVGTVNSKIYIGGSFGKSQDPTTREDLPNELNITRLNNDGTIDATFNPTGSGTNDSVTAILPYTDAQGNVNGLLIGGLFTRYNGQDHDHIVKLNTDGSVDTSFNTDLQAGDTVFALAAQIDPGTGLPNGQILVGGRFNRINKSEPAKLARLNADGSLDTTFNPDFPTRVLALAVQPDGKILVGGDFDEANGRSVNNIVRLNQDGTTDETFAASATGNVNPVNTPPTAVYSIKLMPDGSGRIVFCGNFLKVNGENRINVARLLPDGTLDTDFVPGKVLRNRAQSVTIQNDNKVFVAQTRINRSSDTSPYPNVVVRLYGGPVPEPAVTIAPVIRAARKGNREGKGRVDGRFEISRGAPVGQPLTVTFGIYGTARPAFATAGPSRDYALYDYDELLSPAVGDQIVPAPGNGIGGNKGFVTVVLPAYTESIEFEVVPKLLAKPNEVNRKARFIVQPGNGYEVGAPSAALVKIQKPLPSGE